MPAREDFLREIVAELETLIMRIQSEITGEGAIGGPPEEMEPLGAVMPPPDLEDELTR